MIRFFWYRFKYEAAPYNDTAIKKKTDYSDKFYSHEIKSCHFFWLNYYPIFKIFNCSFPSSFQRVSKLLNFCKIISNWLRVLNLPCSFWSNIIETCPTVSYLFSIRNHLPLYICQKSDRKTIQSIWKQIT